jgi:hypothetical protein
MKTPDTTEKHPPLFREDGKLLRSLAFVPRANAKPASIRVTLQSASKPLNRKAKETMFTLENKSFHEQYHRAVAALADFRGIPADDPVRLKMEATADEFLRYFGLKTRTVTKIYEEVTFEQTSR